MASTRLLERASVATLWRLPQFAANASANLQTIAALSADRAGRSHPRYGTACGAGVHPARTTAPGCIALSATAALAEYEEQNRIADVA